MLQQARRCHRLVCARDERPLGQGGRHTDMRRLSHCRQARPALQERMRQLAVALLLWFFTGLAAAMAVEETVTLASGTSVTSQRYGSRNARTVVLWMTGQYGPLEAEQHAAEYLAGLDMQVWLTDWLAPYFLPQTAGSIEAVPVTDLAEWLEAMLQRHTGRAIILVASGHAAVLPLRAAVAWHTRHQVAPPVAGAVLLWPLLYREPEPGEDPKYDPVVSQTRLRLSLLVPMSSAGYWWRETMQAAFEAAGSRVSITVLPGLRDRFYHRGDATAQEQAEGARLGEILAPHIFALSKESQP